MFELAVSAVLRHRKTGIGAADIANHPQAAHSKLLSDRRL
jgi:hypothetical protein